MNVALIGHFFFTMYSFKVLHLNSTYQIYVLLKIIKSRDFFLKIVVLILQIIHFLHCMTSS